MKTARHGDFGIFRLPGIDRFGNSGYQCRVRAASGTIPRQLSRDHIQSQRLGDQPAFATASQKDGKTLTPAMLLSMLLIVAAAALSHWIDVDLIWRHCQHWSPWRAGMDPHSNQFRHRRGPTHGHYPCRGQRRSCAVLSPPDDAGDRRPHYLGTPCTD